jgi:hypothetical protein
MSVSHLDRTIAMLNGIGKYNIISLTNYVVIEGRDKFCKMIQYASRFIKY